LAGADRLNDLPKNLSIGKGEGKMKQKGGIRIDDIRR